MEIFVNFFTELLNAIGLLIGASLGIATLFLIRFLKQLFRRKIGNQSSTQPVNADEENRAWPFKDSVGVITINGNPRYVHLVKVFRISIPHLKLYSRNKMTDGGFNIEVDLNSRKFADQLLAMFARLGSSDCYVVTDSPGDRGFIDHPCTVVYFIHVKEYERIIGGGTPKKLTVFSLEPSFIELI